jgi:hypothetical protein
MKHIHDIYERTALWVEDAISDFLPLAVMGVIVIITLYQLSVMLGFL